MQDDDRKIFICPICEAEVSVNDTSCKNCNAEFEPVGNNSKFNQENLKKEEKKIMDIQESNEVKEEVSVSTPIQENVEAPLSEEVSSVPEKTDVISEEVSREVESKVEEKKEEVESLEGVKKEKTEDVIYSLLDTPKTMRELVESIGKSDARIRFLVKRFVSEGKVKQVKEGKKSTFVRV